MLNKLKNLFSKPALEIFAPVSGTLVPLNTVSDPTFAEEMLGKGAAIQPSEGKVVAPINGKVLGIFKTKHAITLQSDFGAEILIHIGIDTVKLAGEHFTAHVKKGDIIKQGDLLIEFDMDAIKALGYDVITPVLVCNMNEFSEVKPVTQGTVTSTDAVIKLTAI